MEMDRTLAGSTGRDAEAGLRPAGRSAPARRPAAGARTRSGRAVAPTERELIRELAREHHLEVEERHRAYLFRTPAWQGQVLRMGYHVVTWPRPEVLRAFTKAVGMMPLPSKYSGQFLKKLRGEALDAYLFRAENRAQLEALSAGEWLGLPPSALALYRLDALLPPQAGRSCKEYSPRVVRQLSIH